MNISQYTQIIAAVIVFAIYIYGLLKIIKSTRGTSPNKWNIVIGFTFATLFCIYLILNAYRIEPAGFAQIILTFGLVLATALYAISATKQADASAKMAEEMREQRIMASRPVIIQRAVYKESDWPDIKIGWTGIIKGTASFFSHFEVYNVGSGPAIEVEISLTDKKRCQIKSLESTRQTLLKANDSPIKFCPSIPRQNTSYYIVSEYQSIFSRGSQPTWYQTWLPFETVEASEKGKIYVIAGELEFSEVYEKDRIDAFGTRSKPR